MQKNTIQYIIKINITEQY